MDGAFRTATSPLIIGVTLRTRGISAGHQWNLPSGSAGDGGGENRESMATYSTGRRSPAGSQSAFDSQPADHPVDALIRHQRAALGDRRFPPFFVGTIGIEIHPKHLPHHRDDGRGPVLVGR